MLACILDEALDSKSNVEQPRQPVFKHSNDVAALTSEEYNMVLDPHDCDALPSDSEAFVHPFDSVHWNNPVGW